MALAEGPVEQLEEKLTAESAPSSPPARHVVEPRAAQRTLATPAAEPPSAQAMRTAPVATPAEPYSTLATIEPPQRRPAAEPVAAQPVLAAPSHWRRSLLALDVISALTKILQSDFTEEADARTVLQKWVDAKRRVSAFGKCDKAFGYARTSGRIRREFEKHANYCASVDRMEDDRHSFGAATAVEDQMDSTMYTMAALGARSALRHEPRVLEILNEWWRVIQRRLHALNLVCAAAFEPRRPSNRDAGLAHSRWPTARSRGRT